MGYLNVNVSLSLRPMPSAATEATMILFTSYLATLNILYTTTYHSLFISCTEHDVCVGLYSTFNDQLTLHVQQTLKNIQKSKGSTYPPRI